MNILLTNDDGYDAKGINVLKEVLQDYHNVFVMAPLSNRSAVSSSITIKGNLNVFHKGKNVWACSGTPVDCVILALRSKILGQPVDLVISGINDGANIGTDIIYSGTCGAARQGVLYGKPAIAVSEDRGCEGQYNYYNLANFVKDNLLNLSSLCFVEKDRGIGNRLPSNPSCFVNVNGRTVEKYKGAVLCHSHGARDYNDTVELLRDGEMKEAFIKGGELKSFGNENSDFSVVDEGKVAVSLVLAEPYCVNPVDFRGFSV